MPPPLVRTLRILAILTLDSRLRERLGLDGSDPADRRLAGRLDAGLQRYYRRLPAWRRRVPSLYLAVRRPTIGLGRRLRLHRWSRWS
jgi:hypothetical protein